MAAPRSTSARMLLTLCLLALASSAPFGRRAVLRAQEKAAARFQDVTQQLGITWKHINGATPEKYLIETMGGGGAFLDFDGDGRLDIFLVQSGCHKFSADCQPGRNALYHQNADGTFTDVAEKAGIAEPKTYGQGVAVGDYDNDGFPDIYITGFPRNVLYHNNGDGTFTDVTAKAGVAGGGWGSAALFFDYDNDGKLDLFAGRYLDWDYDKNIFCGERRPGYRSYCHPDQFKPVSNLLFHNRGDGTFEDVSRKSGIATQTGKALGAVAFDFNRDGWVDLYVANDAVRNLLFKNNGDGTFTEMALLAEVAYGQEGKPESGMGTDAADYDGDGWPDLFVTNIDYETKNLFRNNGDETFTDVTAAANLGAVALLSSGFGTKFFDFDNDGKLDIVELNGHVLDNIHLFREGVTFAERPFLFENAGGKFREIGASLGEAFTRPLVGRALAIGDFNNDGCADILWVMNNGSPILLRNAACQRNSWIGFRLQGTKSNRDAIGARINLRAGGKTMMREIVGGSSYYAAHDLRVLFGLGDLEKVERVEIRWPRGTTTEMMDPAVRRYHTVREPEKADAPPAKPAPQKQD